MTTANNGSMLREDDAKTVPCCLRSSGCLLSLSQCMGLRTSPQRQADPAAVAPRRHSFSTSTSMTTTSHCSMPSEGGAKSTHFFFPSSCSLGASEAEETFDLATFDTTFTIPPLFSSHSL
ncbi:hypothetical protein D9619_013699 [Psilocybe cf. subviscida]|uniref:Uncharacterized protein n=1 Tax=Psilocybe cf. subviscida TaxID=2480587 RepID=A0A8H5EVC0_9AGAR|nr:hypothetical protein D9619_013699 [Psilocybe cf. subviscida]